MAMFRRKPKSPVLEENSCTDTHFTPDSSLVVSIKSSTSENGMIPMNINAELPTHFETDTFEGYALLLARTDPICTRYADLLGDKITFEVQVQGKFKRIPSGRVFVGADSDYVLTLGIFLRGAVQLIIQFLSTFVSHVHYSLGHPHTTPDREITHLVAPLWSTMGSVVVTPPEALPPLLGQSFPETPQQKSFRRQHDLEIDLSSTYSFSMNSYNMDIISWNLIKVPLLQVIPLQTFTGDTPINLVAYEVPVTDEVKYPILHPIEKLNHIFKVELCFTRPGAGEKRNVNGIGSLSEVDLMKENLEEKRSEASQQTQQASDSEQT